MNYDFIIYGGFDVVIKALQSIALIFSDSNYISLFWTLATFGLGTTLIAYYFGAILGRNNLGVIEWARTYWWAIFFFFVLISPAGTLHVYDQHKNRYQAISNLPVGVVLVAGVLNKIEVGLTDMVNTAMAPVLSYADAGNGQGMDMMRELYSFVNRDMQFPDRYDQMTLDNFIVDCYVFAFLSGDISRNAFRTDQDLLNNTFTQANYQAVWTIVYSEANKKGVTMTCADAYNTINGTITSAYLDNMLNSQFCPKMGYDPNDVTELARCKEVLLAHAQTLGGYTGGSAGFLLTQMYISQYINNLMLSGDPVETAQFVGQREAASGMVGVGVLANEFIPIFRSVMLAIAFAITPLLFLFISTFAVEAFGYYLGMLTWLTVWGVMDVMLHNFSMSYGYDLFTNLRAGGFSFNTIFMFDTYSMRVMSVMGYMRVLGVLLSSSIVFGIMKFGGEALARAASSMQGTVEGAGRIAGKAALTVEGRASYMGGLDRGIGTMGTMANYSPRERQRRSQYEASRATVAANTAATLGGGVERTAGAIGSAAGRSSFMDAVKTNSFVQKGVQATGLGEGAFLTFAGRIAGSGQAGAVKAVRTAGMEQVASQHKVSPRAVSYFNRLLGEYGRNNDMEGLVDVVKGSSKDVQKLAMDYGLMKEGASMKWVRDRFQKEVEAASERLSGGMKELGVFDEAGRLNQAEIAVSKSLGLTRDYDGDGEIGDMDRGLGLMKLKEMEHAKGEITLDKDIAKSLTGKTGVNFHAGDRLRWAHDPETGHVTMTRSTGGTFRMSQNGELVEARSGREELHDLAEELRKNGHLISADYLNHRLIPSLKEGESVTVTLKRDNQGRLAGYSVEHGGKVTHMDEADREEGLEIEGYKGMASRSGQNYELSGGKLKQVGEGKNVYLRYTGNIKGPDGSSYVGAVEMDAGHNIRSMKAEDFVQTTTGGVERDVQKKEVDYGVKIGSAMQMALKRDPAIARFVSDPKLARYKPEAYDANVSETAKDLAEDMGHFLSREGLSVGYSDGSVGGSIHGGVDSGILKVFGIDGGFKASTDGRIGRSSKEIESANMLISQYDRMIRKAVTEAREKSFGREETEKYVADKVGNFTQGLYNEARNAKSRDYGADAPTGVARRILNEMGDNVLPDTKEEIEEWKNKPD